MNTENVQKWVDALRSGEFKQTRGALHQLEGTVTSPVGYCCLGVACEISGVTNKYVGDGGEYELFDGESAWLPNSVMEWLGVAGDGDVRVIVDEISGSRVGLVGLNDDGMAFNDIADLIQKTYL